MAVLVATPSAQVPITDRVIEDDVRILLPVVPCQVAGIAARAVRSLRIPMGLEWPADTCSNPGRPRPMPTFDDELVLTGMKLGDALDRLMQLDPTYAWTDAHGVIVIRPAKAWSDREHFLNQELTSFTLREGRIPAALYALQTALQAWRYPDHPVVPRQDGWSADDMYPPRTPEDERTITVVLNGSTTIDALNAVVREHGTLAWYVEYCTAPARYEYATFHLKTSDKAGLGSFRPTRRDDGTWYNPCPDPRKQADTNARGWAPSR